MSRGSEFPNVLGPRAVTLIPFEGTEGGFVHKVYPAVAVIVGFLSMPTWAFAQASIAGVVRDSSGAVLPGVTVEAASPALIEKVRTVGTDGTGQYRIVDLRPGTYTVTFTLQGFSTLKREGIELSGIFAATVNAELRVGALEETITVTGTPPTVDIQNARRLQTIDQETITAIPSGRAFQQIATLIPAVQNQGGVQDVGGSRGPASTSDRYVVHGGVITDSRVQVDGLGTGSAEGGGASGTFYMPNVGSSQEVAVSTSGGMGEAETGGILVNVIPREGGNAFHGSFFVTGANESMQGNNYSRALQDRGLAAPNRIEKVWDISPSVGGPVFRDRLWYFVTARYNIANNYVAGLYTNLNAGNPNAWTYAPDLSRQVVNMNTMWSVAPRLTWQVTPRNKLNVFWDEQPRCVNCPGGSATSTPEAAIRSVGKPNRVQQVIWTSPFNNKLLLEAAFGTYIVHYWWEVGPPQAPQLIGVTEQGGIIPGLTYRGLQMQNSLNNTYNSRASASYVMGAHSLKFGYQGAFFDVTMGSYSRNGGLSYRFNNGVPNQLTQTIDTYRRSYLNAVGLYAQDQWTVNRLTVQGSLRYDRFSSSFPDQQVGPSTDRLRKDETAIGIPSPNLLAAPIAFPSHDGAIFHDVSPRVGAVYDLFGRGKTALKVSLGRYTLGQESSSASAFGSFLNPISRLATSTSRSWADANRNYVPECDLSNLAANGECGAAANQNFGKNVFSVNFDPEATRGWGVRPYQWEFSTSVQQELRPRVSLTAAYFRRWYGNFAVTDNRATTAADYTSFAFPVPIDARLPNSGAMLGGFVDVVPSKFGQVDQIVTSAKNYGTQIQRWNGVDIDLTARPRNGLFFQGGISTGRTLLDNCEVARQLPEILGSQPLAYCRRESPFLTQFKGLGGYTVPRIDVQLTATFQNIPGPEVLANFNAANAVVAPLLGRSLSGGAANVTLALASPMSIYGERLNQIDFRLAKILHFRGTRTQVTFDLFNALNSSAIVAQNNTFGAAWQTPTSILSARLIKISAQFDF